MNPAALAIPDGIEPITGWRYWRADEGWLCSLLKFKTWPPGRALRAQCVLSEDHGPLPGESCGCGIYAAVNLPTLKELLQPNLDSPLVVGEVALWGRVIPAELGFRAELAYPRRLWVVRESLSPQAEDTTNLLAETYRVPVEACDAAWAVVEEAVNPHIEPRVAEIRAAVSAFQERLERLIAALAQGEETGGNRGGT